MRYLLGNLDGNGNYWCAMAASVHHSAGLQNGQLVAVRDDFAPACANRGCAIEPNNPKRILLTTMDPKGGNPPPGCIMAPGSGDDLNSDGSVRKWGGCSAWDCQNPAPLASPPVNTIVTAAEQQQILQQTLPVAPPPKSFLSRNKIPIFVGGTVLLLGFVGMMLLIEF